MNNKNSEKKQKVSNGNLKSNLFKATALSVAIAVSVGITFPSFAENQSIENVDESELSNLSASGNVSSASATDIVAQVQNVRDEATNCADPTNVKGMAYAQAKTLNDMKAMILTPINTDTIFSTASKGGCFNALKDFPNLSTSIPSLTGIAEALKKTLIRYATRKVCNAINDALEEVIGPINDVISEVAKNGEIDLTGELNKKMAEELYKIDPELGRVSVSVTDEYSWEIGDVLANSSTGGIVSSDSNKNTSDTIVEAANNNSSNNTPTAPVASGSYVVNGGEVSSNGDDSQEDISVKDSALSFLRSIF